ncbi:MAG: GGDEF domain-containing protein [Rhizobiaceae bacterium]|nr:GGDEF domain-containing protein [Rhizobiaceae bacterium]
MKLSDLDFSAEGRGRVVSITALGTLVCIAVAFAIDSYSFVEGWRWGDDPLNNLIIPLVLAPPFFYFLLSKLRELAIAHRELLVISTTDSLTECFNRRAFTALVDRYLDRMMQAKEAAEGALLVIDVDHFKTVNDTFGHDTGDDALKLIAATIRKAVRETDVVGRIGGEEFGVFLPGASYALTETVAERIRTAIGMVQFAPRGDRHPLSVSVGGVTFADPSSFSELYRQADSRLYEAKRNGRNRVEIHHPLRQQAALSAMMH